MEEASAFKTSVSLCGSLVLAVNVCETLIGE
jgi:hypothetical protein